MARIARLVMKGEPAVYHVISRTALSGYVRAVITAHGLTVEEDA